MKDIIIEKKKKLDIFDYTYIIGKEPYLKPFKK